MINIDNEVVEFLVRVVPRSSRSEIVGLHDGALKVKLNAPPVDGAANDELVKLLAKEFKVAAGAVEIVRGHASRSKRIRVRGSDPALADAVLHRK